MRTTIRELRSSTKSIFSAVKRGDTVLVTSRGKPCARIVPVFERKKKPQASALFGIWKNNEDIKSPRQYIGKIRKNRYAR